MLQSTQDKIRNTFLLSTEKHFIVIIKILIFLINNTFFPLVGEEEDGRKKTGNNKDGRKKTGSNEDGGSTGDALNLGVNPAY